MKLLYKCCMSYSLLSFIVIGLYIFFPNNAEAKKTLFNKGWTFYREGDEPDTMSIQLPHTPKIEPLVVNDQWMGVCVYSKNFFVPHSAKGKNLFLKFEAAMNEVSVWLNGEKVMEHLGGYLPFVVELTNKVNYGASNRVVLRLNNCDNPITGPKPLHKLDFNTYGGIYRDVWYIEKPAIYITDESMENQVAGGGIFFYADSVTSQAATLFTNVHVRNSSNKDTRVKVVCTLLDKGKRIISFQTDERKIEPGTAKYLTGNGILKKPLLWSSVSPHLYQMRTDVYANGKLADTETIKIGIRDIKITSDGCWINGEKTYLRGVNRHQEYPYLGYALSNNAQYRDAYLIKQGGFDYVRCSHYPPSPAFLDACDELGILVLDAILGWQYFGNKEFVEHSLQSSRELIRRDRNHPCILAWELSINESSMPKSFMDAVHQISKEEYPYPNSYSAGWIDYAYDIYIQARQHRILHPDKSNRSKPLIVSEYGDWEYYAQNAGFNQEEWQDLKHEERSSRQPRHTTEKRLLQQVRNIQEAHNDNLNTHAFSDGYWAMFDYNRGYSEDLEYSGVMDIFRLPKYSYFFMQSQKGYDEDSILYIASRWEPGKSENVRVFSNCDEVELVIDGTTIGRQVPDQDDFSTNLKHPPFTFNVSCKVSGSIKAIGFKNGIKVKEEVVCTAGTPYLLELGYNEAGKRAEAGYNDAIFVYAFVKDKNGTIVNYYNSEVRFKVVTGDAKIIGNGMPHAEAGIAPTLLQIGEKKQSVKVRAESNNLVGELLVEVK
ncbi:hypothetical protein HMPREF9447_03056 [Bacteroides oleiciplenus YIT 12058]|uniref:Beta-galactosidase n=2 Tax=Bacteroides oleiciplenus TaxID=626931 RepID=K9DYV8_9BACE|nr:hypothetical protein HMPREF9447_03056 [Bacteroides oleiciplenus YIT 12058]